MTQPASSTSQPSSTPHDDRTTAAPAISAARERILRTADRLFYEEGIREVGIQRIIAEAGVTRVTLYRHFTSKDDLVSAYLANRAEHDRRHVNGIIDAHRDDPRRALDELATVSTGEEFAPMRRGCPFINASAELDGSHPARVHALEIRRWHTERFEELLRRLDHASPRETAAQLMMVLTGAIVSGALDANGQLDTDFLDCWTKLVDDGLPHAV